MTEPLTYQPIGVVRSPYFERAEAPRQPRAATNVRGVIELERGRHLEDAVEDLEGFSHVWVVFAFEQRTVYKPKVFPPRSTKKRGVLATRAPHRPCAIGLSVVALERVDGLSLHVRELDMLDGTLVLDIKPYVPWADAIPNARAGWLEEENIEARVGEVDEGRPADPRGSFEVVFAPAAREAIDFVDARGEGLERRLQSMLAHGPTPHAYRRIRPLDDGTSRIASKRFRAKFRSEGTTITVLSIHSDYRDDELERGPDAELHRAFITRFGATQLP